VTTEILVPSASPETLSGLRRAPAAHYFLLPMKIGLVEFARIGRAQHRASLRPSAARAARRG